MTTLPGPLVEPDWLAAHLDAPDLRIIETTVFLDPPTRPGTAYDVRPGRAEWEAGHIPGSAFADLNGELAEPDPTLNFTFPTAERFEAAMSALGVEDGTVVVAYDRNGMQWATRLWFMLRAYGFDDAGVLDGGWTAWTAAGLPVSVEPPLGRAASFRARLRPDLLASREEVLAASSDEGAVCLLNALAPEVFRGEQNRYGRAGRIPGSVNVFAKSLLDPSTGRLVPAELLRERLAAAGALRDGRVITYCGGGISATLDAFALTLLGAPDVALYDGSMSEWIADPALPLERG
jgi:thiosulfate/3-mercaptopyruvate sulfurtransferase